MQGLCDNLLTCIVRAWSPEKPLLVAPAMNTMMWESPFTKQHLDRLESMLDANIIEPVCLLHTCRKEPVCPMHEAGLSEGADLIL